jgi:hypothetical protein
MAMPPSAEPGTGQALVEFLDRTAAEAVPASTAGNWRSAAVSVLSAASPGWLTEDVLGIDVDRTLASFTSSTSLAAGTRDAYADRVRKLMATFAAWSEDPAGDRWRQIARSRRPRGKDRRPRGRPQSTPPSSDLHPASTAPGGQDACRAYPFQVRRGVWIDLRLPVDFTAAEAERLAGFVRSVALD